VPPTSTRPRAQRVAFGTSGHRGSSLDGAFNDDHIARHHAGDLEYRAAQGIDGPALRRRRHPRAQRPRPADGAGSARRQRRPALVDAARPLRADAGAVARDHSPQPGRHRVRKPTASSSRPRTTRRATAASSTTRRTVGRPTATSRAGSPGPRERALAAATARCLGRRSRLTAERYDYREHYVADLATASSTSMPMRASRLRIGADPLGGASVDYWALIAERTRPRPDVVNPTGRPAVAVHDPRLGRKIRMDCPRARAPWRACSAGADDFDLRHGQRRRRRPARHRHPRRRADEPQPLPRRRDRVPLHAPPRLARRCGGRQDPRLVVDDRPRRRRPRTARCGRCRSGSSGSCRASSTARSPSAARRARSELPAPRRHRLDDRQGRHSARLLAAEILAVTGSTPSSCYADLTAELRLTGLRACRCPGHPRAEGQRSAARRPSRSRRGSWRATRSRQR
jgi:hypothetical protein